MPERRASTARADEPVAPARSRPGAAAQDGRVAVLLPLPLAGSYDYLAPSELSLEPGAVVRAPLGGRNLAGVVWDRKTDAPEVSAARLKPVIARYDVPPMGPVQRRFIDWVANYTMAPPGAVLRMALSVPAALAAPKPVAAYRLSEGSGTTGPIKLTAARRRVLAALRDGPACSLTELTRAAGVSGSVVARLCEHGLLERVALPEAVLFETPGGDRKAPVLSADQEAAAAGLRDKVRSGGFSTTLLDGVTGSGKTEVYFEAIAATLARRRQALVLLPEIALSAQWLDRFRACFGVAPALWHSEMTAAQRRGTWRAVAFGEARVVVGARSALFLPLAELGLIVVDEEHDAAFKQEEGVIYHARDMAVVRARLGEIPIVLVSATPALETVTNVGTGRYGRLRLPDRHGGATLPAVELVDLRRDRPPAIEGLGQSWLSPTLRRDIAETLGAGEQALLFLNRRGYAPLTLCRACGHRMQCPHCTAWLVEHRLTGKLLCHHCGTQAPLPQSCPNCATAGALAACGPGVERLLEEATVLFPTARRAVMTSDTITTPSAAARLLEAVREREIDLLIGTQMAAKGHHFPYLTLVGVVDADLGLYGGDLRAAERTYQLLHQVAGRAGRAERPGRVLIQTSEPRHPVMQALAGGERDRFLEIEAESRNRAALPPFGRLAALIVSGRDPRILDTACRALAHGAPRVDGVTVLGPAPAPLAVLRGRHRRRFLVKGRQEIALQGLLRNWLAAVKLPRSLRLQIDIDPQSFL